MNYLQETLTTVGDQQLVSQRAKTVPVPNFPADYPICMDGLPVYQASTVLICLR